MKLYDKLAKELSSDTAAKPTSDSQVSLSRHMTKALKNACCSPEDGDIDELALVDEAHLYIYSDGHWRPIGESFLAGMTQEYDSMFLKNGKVINLDHSGTKGIAKSVLTNPRLGWWKKTDDERESFFEIEKGVTDDILGISAPNGFFHIGDNHTVKCRTNKPSDKQQYQYPFNLSINSKPPTKYLKFLDTLFLNDKDKSEKISLVQQFLGGALLGIGCSYGNAKTLLMIGEGGNGKSIFTKTLQCILPKEQVTASLPTDWTDIYTRAMLRGSRLNISAEIPLKCLQDGSKAGMFKSITSGDGVQARSPYGLPFYLQNRSSVILSANLLSDQSDTSNGFWRRIILLIFDRNFYELDGERRTEEEVLKDAVSERAEILMWGLQGACDLVKQGGYTIPVSSQEALNTWRKSSDVLTQFIDEECESIKPPDVGGVQLRLAGKDNHRDLEINQLFSLERDKRVPEGKGNVMGTYLSEKEGFTSLVFFKKFKDFTRREGLQVPDQYKSKASLLNCLEKRNLAKCAKSRADKGIYMSLKEKPVGDQLGMDNPYCSKEYNHIN